RSKIFFMSSSEYELEPKLNLPRRVDRRRDAPGTSQILTSAIEYLTRRQVKVGVIENVEELRPKFSSQALADACCLVQREVNICKPGPAKNVPARVPEVTRRRQLEGCWVEVPVGIVVNRNLRYSGFQIRSIRGTGVAASGTIETGGRGEGCSGMYSNNTAEL